MELILSTEDGLNVRTYILLRSTFKRTRVKYLQFAKLEHAYIQNVMAVPYIHTFILCNAVPFM